jgi:hypothetical protein
MTKIFHFYLIRLKYQNESYHAFDTRVMIWTSEVPSPRLQSHPSQRCYELSEFEIQGIDFSQIS